MLSAILIYLLFSACLLATLECLALYKDQKRTDNISKTD